MQKRTFLKLLAAGLVSVSAVFHTTPAFAKKYGIALSKLPALNKIGGQVTIKLGGKDVLLVRISKSEVLGFDGLCTHQSCPVVYHDNKINCNCHGSHFDLNGKVKSGPATRPLPKIPVQIDGDRIVVG